MHCREPLIRAEHTRLGVEVQQRAEHAQPRHAISILAAPSSGADGVEKAAAAGDDEEGRRRKKIVAYILSEKLSMG